MIGWPQVASGALAVAFQSSISVGTFVVAGAVLLIGGWAVSRSKGLEAWKETANAASLGRAEAEARNEQLEKQVARERELSSGLQERLDVEKRKTDLTPLTQKMLEVLSNGQAAEQRAESRHTEMMQLLAQVVKNTDQHS